MRPPAVAPQLKRDPLGATLHMRYAILALALTCLQGCQRARTQGKPATEAHALASPGGSEPEAEDYCLGDTTVLRPDPGRLVREFLVRDGAGEFLGPSPFWHSATECAGEGTDQARVVESYSVDSLGIQGDSARFAVTYHFLGDLVQADTGFVPRIATVVDTFLVVRRRWGWRIVGLHDVPTLLPDSAKARWRLTPDDRARLDSAVQAIAGKRGT